MTRTKKRPQYRSIIAILPMILFLSLTALANAGTADIVNTYQDENGWKLQVNGEDYFVKGIVWGYTPIGENYSYNLWGHPDEYVKKVLDYECNLMKAAGINTIRSFGMLPPRWVTYIYEEHGIMTIINHLMGRYGYNIDGTWMPNTNYQDELTRQTLKNDIMELVRQYKDTPGVLMFALGNESNYGLSWSSFEIEDLPVGEQHKGKAVYLYTLFNDIIKSGKEIDQNHPFTFVNGDIQYLDLIVEHCPDIDLLGVNAYRGISFTDLWERVEGELGLPVVLMEFGSDAFNARTNSEDQAGQAGIIKGNWDEIYNKSYGKEEEGIALGGCLFEWRDEWWKYLQVEDLFIQNNHASWSNGGYNFDFAEGKNNMNEEWFGICALGGPNDDKVFTARPRAAYEVMKDVWSIDPYQENKTSMNQKLQNVSLKVNNLTGNLRWLMEDKQKKDMIKLIGGSLRGDLVFNGKSEEVEDNGKNGLNFSNGEMIFLDFGFQPTGEISGNFTLNILGNVVDKQLEEYYGKRGETYTTVVTEFDDNAMEVTTSKDVDDFERLEIYSFEAVYSNEHFDLTTFYHVPRFHWIYDGDQFGLLYEATDMEGMDIWNAKAPYGMEFVGRDFMPGLTIVAGPEVYWGANPKAMVKYDFSIKPFDISFIHSEDFSQADASSTATEATERATRKTSLNLETTIIPKTKIQIGYLFAGSEKIDEEFKYVEDDNDDIYEDKIDIMDTQGIKAKISVNLPGGTILDASAHYAGLVADGGSPLREFDTTMPYSSLGNKMVFEGGLLVPVGNFWLLPRGFYRKNLVDANPIMEAYTDGTEIFPGLTPRNRDADPFAVLDNREAISGEFFLTYDPTPASYFYDWDNDRKEDAKLAFSIGGNYTQYETVTDANLFFYQAGNINASFGKGMPKADVWLAKGRFIVNPNRALKIIANLEVGEQQASGTPEGGLTEYYTLDTKVIVNKMHYISAYAKKDAWGPLDWYRQFNITFPYQFMLDYSVLIDNFLNETFSSRIGFRSLLRTLNEDSPGNETDGVNNDYEFQTGLYYRLEFK